MNRLNDGTLENTKINHNPVTETVSETNKMQTNHVFGSLFYFQIWSFSAY